MRFAHRTEPTPASQQPQASNWLAIGKPLQAIREAIASHFKPIMAVRAVAKIYSARLNHDFDQLSIDRRCEWHVVARLFDLKKVVLCR